MTYTASVWEGRWVLLAAGSRAMLMAELAPRPWMERRELRMLFDSLESWASEGTVRLGGRLVIVRRAEAKP